MSILIIKLGATGDVVRTTPVLRRFTGKVDWLTAAKNRSFLEVIPDSPVDLCVYSWEERSALAGKSYDLVISLEDDLVTGTILKSVRWKRVFGAYAAESGEMKYTPDARRWFDLSLISVHGRQRADELKFQNRYTYQELIFEGLGLEFRGEEYLLPKTAKSTLQGDVAIAPEAGAVWPMKKWAYYDELRRELEGLGLVVNVLPTRATLLEHLADVRGHRCVVSGDSLPMHLALGSGVKSVALFTCTSPWEICDYGLLKKIISPQLGEFFYRRGFDPRATTAISLEEVSNAVMTQLKSVESDRKDLKFSFDISA